MSAPTFGGEPAEPEAAPALENKIQKSNSTLISYSQRNCGKQRPLCGRRALPPPSGQFVTADGEYTYEDAFEMYKEQITILKNAGVSTHGDERRPSDGMLWETLAAVDAANSVCDLPVMCTVTVEADGSIFSGGNAVEAAVAFESAGAAAVGINCSVRPDRACTV